MKTVDLITYQGQPSSLVWRSDVTDFNVGSQLIVPETQEALLFRDGMALDLFGPGRHELTTNNVPLLRRIYEKITQTPTVFHSQVYFINKTISEELLWGTSSPIQLEDPKYGILIDVKSFGSFKISVADSRKFILKIVGVIDQFTKERLQDYFRNEMISKVKTELAKAIRLSNMSILDITTSQDELAEAVKDRLMGVFMEYGLQLNQFVITAIKAKDEDLQRLRKIKEDSAETIIGAAARKRAMDTLGTNYREMESFDVMKEAAKNQADGGLVGLGVGLGIAPAMKDTLSQNLTTNPKKVCNHCSAENPNDAKFCHTCGEKFVSNVCPNCHAELASDARFCGQCGTKLVSNTTCPNCQTENEPNTRFCKNCGQKLN